jgi:dimethylaniline monooxygenase (N-oxide forming)
MASWSRAREDIRSRESGAIADGINRTIRSDFIEKVKTGLIKIERAEVDSINQHGLLLSTGKQLDVDIIVSATGYNQFDLPYLPSDAVRNDQTPQHAVDLHKLIISQRYKNLFFVGFTELFGPLPPSTEAQSRYIAALVSGHLPYPTDAEMAKAIQKLRKHQDKTYVRSERHTLIQPGLGYIDEVLRPLGAVPSFIGCIGRCFTGNPIVGLKILMAVYFGVTAGAAWRLTGHGAKPELAKQTLLRISGKNEKLSEKENLLLAKTKAQVTTA